MVKQHLAPDAWGSLGRSAKSSQGDIAGEAGEAGAATEGARINFPGKIYKDHNTWGPKKITGQVW